MKHTFTLRKQNLKMYICILLLSLLIIAVYFGPWIAPNDPLLIQLNERLQQPSIMYPLGTDHLGRCILSRILAGAPLTLGLSFAVITIIVIVGTFIGILAGYKGGLVDSILMRLTDATGALPDFLLAVAVAGFAGPSLFNVMMAIACVKWISYARLIRGIIMAEREKEYVLASIVAGSNNWNVIKRHLLRKIATPLGILVSGDIGKTILLISALSFLGLGAQPPSPEWGAMLNDGRSYFQSAPHLMFFPGLCIFFVVFTCNILSDSLRDRMDVSQTYLRK